jgi:peptidoglycan/xylan/chitin deacetylase (PgdA/CDA1 family)
LTYASIAPANELWGPVTWRGAPSQPPRCALTFDDGPSPQSTPRILDVLAEEKVAAAFFVVGRNAENAPEILQRIHRDGHLIGNHSFDHSHLGMMHRQAYWQRQIRDTDELIQRIVGVRPRYFRPPMGVRTWHITAAARANGHAVITWTRRARDGFATTPALIIRRLTSGVAAGDILLLHDGVEPHSRRDPTASIECVRPLIRTLRERQIEPVRLDELFDDKSSTIHG